MDASVDKPSTIAAVAATCKKEAMTITAAIRDRFWALIDEPSPLIEAIDY